MTEVIFSLDYEIHGNGEGCPLELMVEPTDRMLRQFDRYGAKLTILADIGEILKFKEYAETHADDRYHYRAIAEQLCRAVRTGHDVQLHIHASYFNSHHDGQGWVQDWSEYDFAGLPPARMSQLVRAGKEYLESLLKPVKPDYRCTVFRAANWSVSPSPNVVRALTENGLEIETSVFKYGRREGLVTFDYSDACSEALAWRASTEALWKEDSRGRIWEVPIYSESRSLLTFLTANRVYRAIVGRLHRVPRDHPDLPRPKEPTKGDGSNPKPSLLFGRHAWKADFNQCTGRQLVTAVNRAHRVYGSMAPKVPFVLIGHSKIFTKWNERSLEPFLAHVAAGRDRFEFGLYSSLGLPALGQANH